MAVNAKFQADFKSFHDAVQKAEVSLKGFESGAGNVEKALNRMANGFSGVRVVQEATTMAAAVERIGGTSKLTQAELERIGAKATEAVEKIRALGGEAPRNIQALADAAHKAEAGTSSLGGSLTKMFAVITGGVTVGTLLAGALRSMKDAAINVVGSAFEMNAKLETTTLQFTTLMGSATQAQAHVRDLFEFAKRTPFETGPIIEASLKLQTFGGAALNTKQNLTLLGDASAATNAPIQELGFWVGRMYANLKAGQPFGEAALRLQELAVLTPQARTEMENLQKAGKSGEEVFAAFQRSLGGFTGAMEKQATTWEGVTSTIKDSINIFLADTLKPYFEVIRDLGVEVTKALDGLSADMSSVSASTRDTKDAFADLVGQGTTAAITGFAYLMVEVNAAQVVFKDLIQIIDLARLSLSYLYRALIEGSTFSLAKDKIAELTVKIEGLKAAIDERGKSLQEDKKAQQDWVEWAERVNKSVAEMVTHVRSSAKAQAEFVGPTQAAAKASEAQATQSKAAAKAIKDMASVMREVNSVGDSLADTIARIDGSVVEGTKYYIARGIALDKIAKLYGITKEQVEAVRDAMKEEAEALKETIKSIEESEKAGEQGAKAVAASLKGMQDTLKNLAVAMGDVQLHGKQMNEQILRAMPDLSDQAKRHMQDLRGELHASGVGLKELADMFVRMGQAAQGSLGQTIGMIGQFIVAMEAAKKSGSNWGIASGWNSSDAATRNASRFGTVAAVAGGALDIYQATGGNQGKAAGAKSGAIAGAKAGLAFGPYGVAIGAGVGALVGLARGMGVTQQEKDAREAIKSFETQLAGLLSTTQKLEAGGMQWKATTIAVRDAYLATGRSSAEAEKAVQKLWDSSKLGAEATKKAMAEINAVLDEQKQDQADLQAAIDKYHFTIEELGPAMQKQQLSEQAAALMNDFRLLAGSGIDVGVTIEHMSDALNDYIKLAKRTGQEVPSEMKPIIQKMIEMGKLTDENGNAIETLEDSGIKFSETMTQGFDRIVKKFDELINRIASTTGALNAIPSRKDIDVQFRETHNVEIIESRRSIENDFAAMGGYVGAHGVQYFGTGGVVLPFRPRGSDRFPVMAAEGEGFLTKDEVTLLGGASGFNAFRRGLRSQGAGMGRPQVIQVVLPNGRVLAEVVNDHNDRIYHARRRVGAR